jgi:hypothetical protein
VALTILDDSMSSDRTAHQARLMPGRAQQWEVSWLPGRRFKRNGAITAMVLADLTGPGDFHAGDRQWIFIQGWADELGLRASDAVARISEPPAWEVNRPRAAPAEREAAE